MDNARQAMIEALAAHEVFLAQLGADSPETGNITGEWAGLFNRRVLELSDLGLHALSDRYGEISDA